MNGIGPQGPATRIIFSDTLPAACSVGQVYVVPTGGSAGMYVCFATDTWTLLDSSVSGEVTGSGATNHVTKWTNGAGSVIGDSALTDDGTTLIYPGVFSTGSIALTAAHSTDNTFRGMTITGRNNSGGVTQWDTVYLNSSSQWVLADANGSGTYPARGMAVASALTGVATIVLTYGTVRNDAWNWTPGGTLYLSTSPGGLTQSAPATSGDQVQAVGYALTADIAFFDFNSTYLTVA